MKAPKTFSQIFDAFGSTANLGQAIEATTGEKFTRQRINQWKTQGIPFAHFLAIVQAAKHSNIPGVTFEALNKMAKDAKK